MRKSLLHKIAAAVLTVAVTFGVFTNVASKTVNADIAANATVINCNNGVNVREYPTNQSRNMGTIGLNQRIQVTGSTLAASTMKKALPKQCFFQ